MSATDGEAVEAGPTEKPAQRSLDCGGLCCDLAQRQHTRAISRAHEGRGKRDNGAVGIDGNGVRRRADESGDAAARGGNGVQARWRARALRLARWTGDRVDIAFGGAHRREVSAGGRISKCVAVGRLKDSRPRQRLDVRVERWRGKEPASRINDQRILGRAREDAAGGREWHGEHCAPRPARGSASPHPRTVGTQRSAVRGTATNARDS